HRRERTDGLLLDAREGRGHLLARHLRPVADGEDDGVPLLARAVENLPVDHLDGGAGVAERLDDAALEVVVALPERRLLLAPLLLPGEQLLPDLPAQHWVLRPTHLGERLLVDLADGAALAPARLAVHVIGPAPLADHLVPARLAPAVGSLLAERRVRPGDLRAALAVRPECLLVDLE